MLFSHSIQATHIKAGQITAKFIGSSEIEFNMVLYLSIESLNAENELINQQAIGEFTFSDRRDTIKVTNPQIIDVDATTRQYTYTGRVRNVPPGTKFTISYSKRNRNADVLNIPGSIDIPFYIETSIYTSQTRNTLPILKVLPIDEGAENVIFTHNPGAFDLDGDSISYALTTPRSGKGLFPSFLPPHIAQPGQSVAGGASYSRIDPVTGDFVWDTPAKEGLYNVAIEIKEWRKRGNGAYSLLSVTIRDMQINIKKNENKRPEIITPPDTCIEVNVGVEFKALIKAYDPDSILPNYQNILLSAPLLPTGARFNLINPIRPGIIRNSGYGIFTWNAGCADVRQQAYNVTFQAKDEVVQSRQLVTYKSWQLKVNGPRPKIVSLLRQPQGFLINWEAYPCTNVDSIFIFRKDCDTAFFDPGLCEDGTPTNFKKIGSISVTENQFLDTANIVQGNQYSYSLSVVFKGNKNGRSVFSKVKSINTFYFEPILTNISIVKTDSLNGEILVKWLRPVGAKDGNYEYVLSRKSNESSATSTTVFTTTNLADTSYVDSSENLNTLHKQWLYKLELKKSGTTESATAVSSTVFLKAKPASKRIELSWSYNTAWNNETYPLYVYRKKINEDKFIKIDSLPSAVNNGRFSNVGLSHKDTFCYYVETRGRYCADSLPRPFVNLSQVVCLAPSDSTIPCVPKLGLVDEDCNLPIEELLQKPYRNELSWVYDDTKDTTCKTKLKGFNLYKAPDETSEYRLLKFLPLDARTYIDEDADSRAACYSITALSETNMESVRSNIECNDNCVYYALPNLITPNGDTLNDRFNPLKFPLGVKSVKLYMYNRWGALIHYQESGPQLNWNPYEKDKYFTDGVYYYYALITYERRRNPKDNESSLKGWLHIMNKPLRKE